MDTTQAASEVEPTILPLQEDPTGDPGPYGETPPDDDTGPPKG